MQFIKKNWHKFVLLFYAFFVPISVLYADTCYSSNSGNGKITNPLKNACTINGLIETFLKGVIQIGMPVVALAIIYCGFLFVSARGSSEKLTKAKDALLYTLIGAAILLGSWAIATMISNTVLSL